MIQIDMQIPENCASCPMIHEDDLGYTYTYCTGKCMEVPKYGLDGRPEWCPMKCVDVERSNDTN